MTRSRVGLSRQMSHSRAPASAKRSSATSSGSKPRSAYLVATKDSPKATVMPTAAAYAEAGGRGCMAPVYWVVECGFLLITKRAQKVSPDSVR